MLADFADAATLWLAQCYNPYASEWIDQPAVYGANAQFSCKKVAALNHAPSVAT